VPKGKDRVRCRHEGQRRTTSRVCVYSRSEYLQPLIYLSAIRGIKWMEQIKSAYLRAEVIDIGVSVRYGKRMRRLEESAFSFRTSARRTAATDGASI